MGRIIGFVLVIAGVVHLIPVTGALGTDALERLYGIEVESTDLAILLQHRAVLFALLGIFLIAASLKPGMRLTALLIGLVSTSSFVAIALLNGGYGDEIRRVVVVDVFLSIMLATAALYLYMAERRPSK